ncbi:acyltransferase family protein [Opitutales bacterium ASA1]|uniref:acyltransferase family protein n=1 Tax=Congregicoccus parvus TaxID=3081749 RepID=UPI002B28B429|nr:acyltransferase family protein [Opitutales bacterium ASA1]
MTVEGASFVAPAQRVVHLDAVRAFALVLGVVFHAALSFMPVFTGWAVMDVSTSWGVAGFVLVSHAFRMEVFFLVAGYFGHLAFHRDGAGEFVRARFVRLVVPFVVGWFVLRPLIVSGWIMGAASLRGEVDVVAGLKGGFASLGTLPAGIFTGSHLWFLYYLVLITAIVLVVRGVVRRVGGSSDRVAAWGDAGVAWIGRTAWSPLVLAVPTALALGHMRGWGMDTPDQSLRPHFPVLGVYGACFALGWFLRRGGDALTTFSRPGIVRVVLCVLAVATALLLAGVEGEPSHARYAELRRVFQFAYAVMMWTLVMLTLGVFECVCRRPNAAIRYVADSSYWMYLVHLPVVVWLQVTVAEWPFHWAIKIVGVSGVAVAVSLVTYDLFVRSTLVGRVLNGRRRPRIAGRWVRGARAALHARAAAR